MLEDWIIVLLITLLVAIAVLGWLVVWMVWSRLEEILGELIWISDGVQELKERQTQIMKDIAGFETRVTEKLTRIGTGVDTAVSTAGNISGDQQELKRLIKELQDSQGDVWTPEDQARLDRIEALAGSQSDKVDGLVTVLDTLDKETEIPAPSPSPAPEGQ